MSQSDEESTRHRDACATWISGQLEAGGLTPRDVEWLSREPSVLMQFYPLTGVILGFAAAGAASRFALRSTLRPWTFTRTITVAALSASAGYYGGLWAHDWALQRFNHSTDSPTVAMVARFKRRNADAKDQVELLLAAARRRQNEDQAAVYQKTLLVMAETEEHYTQEIVLESMVPDDVQVYSATDDEIREAVEEIIHEEMDEEGVPLTKHDVDLLVQHQTQYWKDRPIKDPPNNELITGGIVGALGIYGRFRRHPPMQWRWLALSAIPIYVTTALFTLGFGRYTRNLSASPDDWWAYQIAGMEVRSGIARSVALNRARRILREGSADQVNSLIGSSSGDARIHLLLPRKSEDSGDGFGSADS